MIEIFGETKPEEAAGMAIKLVESVEDISELHVAFGVEVVVYQIDRFFSSLIGGEAVLNDSLIRIAKVEFDAMDG